MEATAQGARRARRQEQGFTLVELLVVMLVLGILMAIAIPAFGDQRQKAHDTAAKSLAHTAYLTLEEQALHTRTYDHTPAALIAYEESLGTSLNLTVTGTQTTFTLSLESLEGHVFLVRRLATGVIERRCTPVGEGGCPRLGSW